MNIYSNNLLEGFWNMTERNPLPTGISIFNDKPFNPSASAKAATARVTPITKVKKLTQIPKGYVKASKVTHKVPRGNLGHLPASGTVLDIDLEGADRAVGARAGAGASMSDLERAKALHFHGEELDSGGRPLPLKKRPVKPKAKPSEADEAAVSASDAEGKATAKRTIKIKKPSAAATEEHKSASESEGEEKSKQLLEAARSTKAEEAAKRIQAAVRDKQIRLTAEQKDAIKADARPWKVIREEYGISKSTINRIKNPKS